MIHKIFTTDFDYYNLSVDLPKENKKQIYVHASMPCPLKTPFSQLIKPFIKQWNNDPGRLPLYCPLHTDCSTEELKENLLNTKTEKELPDILITTAYDVLFSKNFRQKFIGTGIYGAFPLEYYTNDYKPNILEASAKYHCGFMGFSSWGMVYDKSYKKKHPVPKTWRDIILPEFKNMFSLHGCHGHAGSLSMLLSLSDTYGETMLKKLADNMNKVQHFSKLINEIGSSSGEKTPFYILPYVAIANIPSRKKIEVLSLPESIITPMMFVIKQSKIEECKEVIHFFTGKECKQLLSKGAYFQPGAIENISNHQFKDLNELSVRYFEEVSQLTTCFIEHLGDKMEQ